MASPEAVNDSAMGSLKKQKKSKKLFADEPDFTEEDLRFYYSRLFPFKELVRWLSYKHDSDAPISVSNDPSFFARREFSFSCFPKGGDRAEEIYIRWNFFQDASELQQFILNAGNMYPHKLDIGAVYNRSGKNRTSQRKSLRPVQKEIVFDIDMNDYDTIRTCCKDKKVCKKCWKFLRIAMKVLHRALEKDFGFTQILWVYSGRRGVHCWVCDATARNMTNEERVAIADYLNVITGSAGQKQQVVLNEAGTHPMIDNAVDICKHNFEDLAVEQNLFCAGSPHVTKVLDHIGASNLVAVVKAINDWTGSHSKFTSKEFYSFLLELSRTSKDSSEMAKWMKEIILSFCYPRIDINVTKEINHLLKSPFCVHVKTGRICVPLNIKDIDGFTPECVPTIGKLREEYDSTKENESPETSLEEYVKFFRSSFVDRVIKACSEYNKALQTKMEAYEPTAAFAN